MTGLFEVSSEYYRAAILPSTCKRQTINRKNVFLMVTPLTLLALQTCLLCYLLNRIHAFIPSEMMHSMSKIETCVVFGLILSGLLFILSNLVFSRSIVRRICLIRENIKRCDAGLRPMLPPPDSDELSDLGADIQRLIDKRSGQSPARLLHTSDCM